MTMAFQCTTLQSAVVLSIQHTVAAAPMHARPGGGVPADPEVVDDVSTWTVLRTLADRPTDVCCRGDRATTTAMSHQDPR